MSELQTIPTSPIFPYGYITDKMTPPRMLSAILERYINRPRHCKHRRGAVVSSFQGLRSGTTGYLMNSWEGLR